MPVKKARSILYNFWLVTCEPGWNLNIIFATRPKAELLTYIPLSVTLITFNKSNKDSDFYPYKNGNRPKEAGSF